MADYNRTTKHTDLSAISLTKPAHPSLNSPIKDSASSDKDRYRRNVKSHEEYAHYNIALSSRLRAQVKNEISTAQKPRQIIERPLNQKFTERLSLNDSASLKTGDIYYAMKGGLTGWGTNEKEVFNALRMTDKTEINLIENLYREQYGRNLKKDMQAEFKSDRRYLRHAMTLLEGDKMRSLASELRLEIELPTKDKKHVYTILSDLSNTELKEVQMLYSQTYGGELIQDLSSKLALNKNDKILLLLQGKENYLGAAEFAELLNSKKIQNARIPDLLRKMTAEELQELKENFTKLFPQGLHNELQKIKDPMLREAIAAYLETNRPLAEALILRGEIQHNTLSADKVLQAMQNMGERDLVQMRDFYRQRFSGNLQRDVLKSLSSNALEQKIAKSIFEENGISESNRILLLAISAGKDVQSLNQLISTLGNKPLSEIVRLRQEIIRNHNLNLDAYLARNLKGKEQFEARLSLYGKSQTFEDELNKARARYEFERLLRESLHRKILPNIDKHASKIEQDLKELEKRSRHMMQEKKIIDEDDEIKFYNLLNFFDKDLKAYGNAKNTFFSLISNICAALAAFVAFNFSKDLQFNFAESLVAAGSAYLIISLYTKRSLLRKSKNPTSALSNHRARRRNSKSKRNARRSRRKL